MAFQLLVGDGGFRVGSGRLFGDAPLRAATVPVEAVIIVPPVGGPFLNFDIQAGSSGRRPFIAGKVPDGCDACLPIRS